MEPEQQEFQQPFRWENSGMFQAPFRIWQEETDRELGVIKLGMMKNRFGANFGHCIMRIDYSTLTITEDEHLNDTEASTSTVNTLANLSLN